ncbi:MAG: UDP-N-acetylglucosamine 2-epimerase (non-hydrolyzing) [Caldisericia bacterium]|nr:UDP-N-acetylglucosamine 2-epimerase (non-hydrolyzing) [Caldisericia bacterium]
MKKPTLLIIFGTRPEAIKMAPLVQTFRNDSSFQTKVIITAQHREMLDQVLELFSIQEDYDFNLMKERQTLESITTGVIDKLSQVILQENPDMIFVHGDTTTTFAASLSAFYHHIPIAHVEAGLRSYDMQNPFPEEMNRTLCDQITSLHFCPTKQAKENIVQSSVQSSLLYVTGNTVVDSLLWVVSHIQNTHPSLLEQSAANEKRILVTLHRRESWGQPIESVCNALRDIVLQNSDVRVIFPVHKNPVVRESVFSCLGDLANVNLVEPMDYIHFVAEMKNAYLILSDSGGVQEEAPTFGKPVLLTRSVTERPEGIRCGVVKLVGTQYNNVYKELHSLIHQTSYYQAMVTSENPFGDGQASQRIQNQVRQYFGFEPAHSCLGEFTQ